MILLVCNDIEVLFVLVGLVLMINVFGCSVWVVSNEFDNNFLFL